MSVPQPINFLDAISGHLRREQTSSADRPIRLATVDPAYDPFASYPAPALPVRVTFEGETTLSTKAYPVANGFIPRAGQRVYLLPQGSGYLVAGSINGQALQGFWQSPDGADAGVELGGGSYFDTSEGLVLEGDATINGVAVAGGRRVATGPGAGKLHWANYTPTTDATGIATITHGAGFTPSFVMAGQWGAATGTSPVHVFYISSTATATTVQVRVFLTSGAALVSSSVGVALLLAA